MVDKRKYRRLELEPLRCRVFQEGQLIDLSIGGAFIASERPLPKGSAVTLEIRLPGDRLVRATTHVEWSGDYSAGIGAPCLGMGLSFTAIEPADRIAIARYLTGLYEAGKGSYHVRTDLEARVRRGEQWLTGTMREIGERSVVVETPAVADVGDEIDVLFRLPNARAPLEARGIVIGVGPSGALAADAGSESVNGARGLRVELQEVSARTRDLLRAFLDEAREDSAGEGSGPIPPISPIDGPT